jgi:epoxyqueuosine reductase
VDTGPVLEKSYAAQAGLGWIGKNTTLINENFGSFLFLGEILTDLELPFDSPAPNQCGDCTMCLDSCPTGALTAPGQMDARRCISYLTLEHKSEIPTEFHGKLSGYPAGCDLCQACCPHNAGAPPGREEGFRPGNQMKNMDLKTAKSMTEETFHTFTKKSALERVKFSMWRRNIDAS